MVDEETKTIEPIEEVDDDGFTDELPEPVEETKEEQKVDEPETVVEEPEPEPEAEEPSPYDSEYSDPRLENIEQARIVWNKSYKKMARIKFLISTIVLLGILAGWLIPTFAMKDSGLVPLYIGLGCALGGIAILLIFGIFQRKHDKAAIREYFQVYFSSINAYTLGDYGVLDIQGDVDSKITKEEFTESGIFEVASVGSRDNVVFNYKGMDCALAESAAQVDAGKSLQTVFVGKFLRTHNAVEVSNEGLVIYFQGNDRALPPKKLEELHLCETTKAYKVYGASADKKVLTKKVREGLAKIRTNKLLVDLTIVIKSGRTYWYLGYEDDIMVLPNDKPFDPRFVKQYKDELLNVLEAATLLN